MQSLSQQIRKEVVIAVPAPLIVQRDDEQVGLFEIFQGFLPGSRVVERNRIEDCGWIGVAAGFYTDAEFFDADNPQYYEAIRGTIRNNVIANTQQAGIGLYDAQVTFDYP